MEYYISWYPGGSLSCSRISKYAPTIGNDDDVTKILPSNATDKSTDTEGVEVSSYPDSLGAMVGPPEVEMLVGGSARKIKTKSS